MTSAVFGQMDAFAIAAYLAERNAASTWSGHDVRLATQGASPCGAMAGTVSSPSAR
jgi:hypothetical protein